MNLTYLFFQRINLFSIWFLVTFGILVNISASSVQGLNQFNDNFYFIKRHMAAVLIGVLIFNIGKKINFYSYSRLINFSIVFVTSALFFVLTYGIVRGGSRRWVDLGVIDATRICKNILFLALSPKFLFFRTFNKSSIKPTQAIRVPNESDIKITGFISINSTLKPAPIVQKLICERIYPE